MCVLAYLIGYFCVLFVSRIMHKVLDGGRMGNWPRKNTLNIGVDLDKGADQIFHLRELLGLRAPLNATLFVYFMIECPVNQIFINIIKIIAIISY